LALRKLVCAAMLSMLLGCMLLGCTNGVGDVVVAGEDADEPGLVAYLADLRQAAELVPTSAELRGRLAMAYDANGFTAAAATTYAQAAALDGNDFAWPYLHATMLGAGGDYDLALSLMDRALELNAEHAGAWLQRGVWLLDLDRHAEARAALDRAMSLADVPATRAAATVGVARAMLRQDLPEDAAAILEEMIAHYPHPFASQVLANAYVRAGRTEDARELQAALGDTTPAVIEWPDPIKAERSTHVRGFSGQMQIAERMLEEGQARKALPILQDLRTREPDDRDLLNNLSVAHRMLDQKDRAEALLEEALETHPDFHLFHFNIAVLKEERGDVAGALSHFDLALELDPTLLAAHERKFSLLLKEERYEEALPIIDARLRYGGANPRTHFDAGLVEGALSRWPQAIEQFDKAVGLDPEFARAHLFRGRSLAEAARFEEAERAFATALDQGANRNDVAVARLRMEDLRRSVTP
jgi:tetratricopeptide (TPR) repeat protein